MSLISAIKDAILTESPSDVTVNERSFFSLMIDYKGKGEPLSRKDFRFHSYKGKSLIITRHILQAVHILVLGLIWLIYGFYNLIHKLISGKWRGMTPSPGINMIISSIVSVSTIIMLLYILTFLIKDVVFAPNNARINAQGVVTVDQPCLETQSFFLLNAATFWAPTDISITKGDHVYISVSGSMYSDITDMFKAAESNNEPLYPRSVFSSTSNYKIDTIIKNDTIDVKYCIYGRYSEDYEKTNIFRKKIKKSLDVYPRFGSLLYQVHPYHHKEPLCFNDDENKNVVKQMNFSKDREYHFKAESSGILYLTFNDILLDEDMFNRIRNEGTAKESSNKPLKVWRSLKETKKTVYDSIQNDKIWFQDNIGEVLVNIRIEKSIKRSDLPWYRKPIVAFYRVINHWATKNIKDSGLLLFIILVLSYLIVDVTVSAYYKRKINKDTT